jgi:peptidoglycan/xylan/chitin deacetylase (PgdA/CDA1 family)
MIADRLAALKLALGVRVSAATLRYRECHGVHVLFFHGIADRFDDPLLQRNFHVTADFRVQIALLRRLRVVPLAELAVMLEEGRFPHRGTTVAITFDDGYANNLYAAELLAAARLPWAVFVTTGPVDDGTTIWTVELSLLLLHGESRRLELFGRHWPLESRPEREIAFREIRGRFKLLPAADRAQTMNALRAQFPSGESQRLLARFPSLRSMTGAQVRELAAAGVEIGSHGVDHEIHHANQPAPVRVAELVASKERIAQLTGRECRFFAYPNGDAAGDAAANVRTAGYRLGFTTVPHIANAASERWLVPRMEPNCGLSRFAADLRSEGQRTPGIYSEE